MPRINIATVREIPEWFQSRRCNHLAQVEVFTHITNFFDWDVLRRWDLSEWLCRQTTYNLSKRDVRKVNNILRLLNLPIWCERRKTGKSPWNQKAQ